jgi:ribosomal protein S14
MSEEDKLGGESMSLEDIKKAIELSNRLAGLEPCIRCGRDRYDIDIVSGMCEDCQREAAKEEEVRRWGDFPSGGV